MILTVKMVIKRRLTIASYISASGTAELIPVGLLRTDSIRDEPFKTPCYIHLHKCFVPSYITFTFLL